MGSDLEEIAAHEERECAFFEGRRWEGLPTEERESRMLRMARSAWLGGKVLVVLWSDGTFTKCPSPTVH